MRVVLIVFISVFIGVNSFGQQQYSAYDSVKIKFIDLLKDRINLHLQDSIYRQGNYEVAEKKTINPKKPKEILKTQSISGFDARSVMVCHLAFNSGSNSLDYYSEALLKESFKQYLEKDTNTLKRIEVYGHTDLERPRGLSTFDVDGVCFENGVGVSTNHCLGLARAKVVHTQLREFFLKNNRFDLLSVLAPPQYHDHFFLGFCNGLLNGDLLSVINSRKQASYVKQLLGMEEQLSAEDIRSLRRNDNIYVNFLQYEKSARQQFKPFRSVVIMNYEPNLVKEENSRTRN